VAKSVGGAIGSLWNDMTGKIAPATPTEYLPAQISEEDKQFFAILEAVGLTLKEVAVSKGLMPSANYRFVAAREPTDADIATAEALLRAYRDGNDAMRARAKQRIARSTLDTLATKGFALTAMDVTLSPWPDASYQIVARPGTGDAAAPPKP
jgi:predicted transcriptional regulator